MGGYRIRTALLFCRLFVFRKTPLVWMSTKRVKSSQPRDTFAQRSEEFPSRLSHPARIFGNTVPISFHPRCPNTRALATAIRERFESLPPARTFRKRKHR